MFAALALLLAFQPHPEVRWACGHSYDQPGGQFRITRQLRADGLYLVDDVFWMTPLSSEIAGLAGWHLTDGEPRRFLTRHLSGNVVLSRRPRGALWSVVRVDGRTVGRNPIPADESVQTDAQGRLKLTLLYVERRIPGGQRTPIGHPPNLEGAGRVEMSVEEADGTVLGTVLFSLPDWAALRTTVARARPLLLADASDYLQRCWDERYPTRMPPSLSPPPTR
jgi:hypothetical protein